MGSPGGGTSGMFLTYCPARVLRILNRSLHLSVGLADSLVNPRLSSFSLSEDALSPKLRRLGFCPSKRSRMSNILSPLPASLTDLPSSSHSLQNWRPLFSETLFLSCILKIVCDMFC